MSQIFSPNEAEHQKDLAEAETGEGTVDAMKMGGGRGAEKTG